MYFQGALRTGRKGRRTLRKLGAEGVTALLQTVGHSTVLLGWSLFGILLSQTGRGQEATWDYCVQVSSQIQTNPLGLMLSWPLDTLALPDYYTVSRKAPKASNWGPPTVLPGTATNYLDTNITLGVPYEYQLFKSTSNHVGYGYISAGVQLPLIENRGKIILLVEQSLASALSKELARLQQDLVGDGWTVLRHDISSNAAVPDVKALVQNVYATDPTNLNSLFLLGHVPVPYSGEMAPDGHPDDHMGAWPADVFYGNFDGVWTDTTVSNLTSAFTRNHNVPGDGKFDQSETPGPVQLQIGRVDLYNMPGRDTNWVPTFPSEGELMRRYLDKDHNYRQKKFSLPARGLVYDLTGVRGGEAFADDAWRNYAALLGPPPAPSLIANRWLPILSTNGYQWAYATSGAGPTTMWWLGGSYWFENSASTVDFVQMDMQTVFTMLLGSWIGDWDQEDNLMRAVLATPTYGLSCVYAGRPHWYFHPMGIGETLGYCARLTQNNHAEGLYRNASNNFAGFAHIALMGDPTLRLHTVAPPSDVAILASATGMQLSWAQSSDAVAGYHVYRSPDPGGPFVRLTQSLLTGTNFVDAGSPPAACTYMVRAVALQSSASGSYYNPSQGAFAAFDSSFAVELSGSPTNLTLTWPGIAGRVYRVLWTDSLSSTNWLPYGEDLLAVGSRLTWSPGVAGTISGSGWVSTNSTPSQGTMFVWVDDALPAGALPGGDSEPWNWVGANPAPYSGRVASQSGSGPGLHQHYFSWATATMAVGSNDLLTTYVYLDPTNVPGEILLQWGDGNSWEHRAFWGNSLLPWGALGTAGLMPMGPLPATGQWVGLQVPAGQVGLSGSTVTGMAFAAYNGRATWDYAGTYSPPANNASGPSSLATTLPAQRYFKIQVVQ